jgi:hypothetical protein
MNKSITSLASITAVLFTLGLASQAAAEQGKSTQVTRSNISNNKAAPGSPECGTTEAGGDCDDAASVKSSRDAASGQATGKRQHMPVKPVLEADGSDEGSTRSAPRDAASGQATGKRQAVAGDETAADGNVETSRDAGSGMASGKRQHKPAVTGMTADVDGDGAAEGGTRAQDHNSSRSNKTSSAVDNGGGDGDATTDAQPQTYKAKAGKTGSAK